jgi:hypothetical protein
MATVISAKDFNWKGSRLYFEGRIVARIASDAIYPRMWRVIRPDGSLSDMANLTRARDAAVAQVLRNFNGKETALEAAYRGQDENSDPGPVT